jgi:hypothetical protein
MMTTQPSAGTARSNITPDWPVMLAGFGQRTTPSSGINDPIFAKALYLVSGANALLIVTADLLCIPAPLGRAVISAVAAQTGLAPEQVCVCASHTHSAPMPVDAHDGATGIERYAVFVERSLIDVAVAARAAARPCRLRSGVGHTDVFLNRRTRGNPNVVDPRVAVLAVDAAETGAPIAVLFGVGCHPVTMGWDNMRISGDFPGHAQQRIEAALPGVNALFFNTTEGNVIPRTSPNLDALDPRGYCGGGYADTVAIGAAIAAEVLRVRDESPTVDRLALDARRSDLRILPNNAALDAPTAAARLAEARGTLQEFLGVDFEAAVPPSRLWSAASQRVIDADLSEADMRRLMIACCFYLGLRQRLERGASPRPVEVPVQVMRINDFELLALPGEVLVEVGQEWSRRAGSTTAFIVGLANAHLRYLPSAAHFDEAQASVRYETVTAGLEPNGVEQALDAAVQLRSAM